MTPGRKFSTTTSASGDELQEDLPRFLLLQVQRDRLLVRVLREEARPHELLVQLRDVAELSREVAVERVLDLDHLGAEEREVERRVRARENVREVEDADRAREPSSSRDGLHGLRRRRDRSRPVDPSGHLAPEEGARPSARPSTRAREVHVGTQARPLPAVDEVLRRDVARRDLRERAAAEARRRRTRTRRRPRASRPRRSPSRVRTCRGSGRRARRRARARGPSRRGARPGPGTRVPPCPRARSSSGRPRGTPSRSRGRAPRGPAPRSRSRTRTGPRPGRRGPLRRPSSPSRRSGASPPPCPSPCSSGCACRSPRRRGRRAGRRRRARGRGPSRSGRGRRGRPFPEAARRADGTARPCPPSAGPSPGGRRSRPARRRRRRRGAPRSTRASSPSGPSAPRPGGRRGVRLRGGRGGRLVIASSRDDSDGAPLASPVRQVHQRRGRLVRRGPAARGRAARTRDRRG